MVRTNLGSVSPVYKYVYTLILHSVWYVRVYSYAPSGWVHRWMLGPTLYTPVRVIEGRSPECRTIIDVDTIFIFSPFRRLGLSSYIFPFIREGRVCRTYLRRAHFCATVKRFRWFYVLKRRKKGKAKISRLKAQSWINEAEIIFVRSTRFSLSRTKGRGNLSLPCPLCQPRFFLYLVDPIFNYHYIVRA